MGKYFSLMVKAIPKPPPYISHISLSSITGRHTFSRLNSTWVEFFISLNFSQRQCLDLDLS